MIDRARRRLADWLDRLAGRIRPRTIPAGTITTRDLAADPIAGRRHLTPVPHR